MPPVSHHYNPQVYLRQFVNPSDRKVLWEFDLRTGLVNKSKPKDSGCEDFYHSIESENGVPDDESIEHSFHPIENKLPQLFETVRNKRHPTPGQWATLCSFAALQRSRNPRTIRSTQKFLSEVFQMSWEIWKGAGSSDFDEAMAKHGMEPEQIRRADFEIKANRDHALLLPLASYGGGKLMSLFGEMRWGFIVAPPDRYFFTSDDPVCCWAPADKRGPFGAVGPASADVEVTFPLSRRTCAFGSWESRLPQLYHPATSQETDGINCRTVLNGWRFVYGPTNDARILSIVEARAKPDSHEDKPS